MKHVRLRLATLCAFAALAIGPSPARACTIFVLTDDTRSLFFNNEDWFIPATRLWFVPAGEGHLGCAFLGFDNGWAQGGLNTAGLAFDWVSGFDEKNYQPDPALLPVRGNPAERMLESCTTVEEAIAFFRKYREPDFARSRILIADRTGASVVIGSKDGRLHTAPLRQSRGFGYGRVPLEEALAKSPEPTVASGAAILRACLQPGDGGTKYSNVFDLKSGDIVLFPSPTGDSPARDERVTLHLATEVAKGGHYFDLPNIRAQLDAPPQKLLANMKRFYLDEFTPLADREPTVTARVRAVIDRAAAGKLREADFAPEFWKAISAAQQEIQADLQRLGALHSLALVGRHEEPAGRSYRYLLEFERARVLGRYVLDADSRIVLMQSEFAEPKPTGATTN